MTNKQLHIGIDLALKMFNHNLLGRMLPEEKDYILNKTITNLVHKTAEDARHSVINVESYSDITAFYNVLEPLLVRRQLEPTYNVGIYSEYKLPKFIDVLDKQGSEIITNIDYKVEQVGNINTQLALLDFSVPLSYAEDDILTLTIPNVVFVEILVDDLGLLDIFAGVKYKILRASGLDFTPYGAANNKVGTIFTCTTSHTFSITLSTDDTPTTELEVISYTPPSWVDTILVATKNLSMFDHIAVNTLISTNSYLRSTNNAKLVKGTYYRVVTGGLFTNLTSFGSDYELVEENYIFMATASGTPTWGPVPVAVLESLTDSTCRLIKPQDVSSMLNHSYGTTETSPFATFGNNKVQIYHANKYSIVSTELVYVSVPAVIDSNSGSETDLNVNLHPTLVTLAVQDIVSTNNPQVYPTVNAQVQQQK